MYVTYIAAGSPGNICVNAVYPITPCTPAWNAIQVYLQIPIGSSLMESILSVDAFGGCAAIQVKAAAC